MQKRKTLLQSLTCLKVRIQLLLSTTQRICNLLLCLIFWNNAILAHITEKYMEFDLNDKGEIGKLQFFSNIDIVVSVVTHRIRLHRWEHFPDLHSLNYQFYRYNGLKTNAGKTWIGQDSLGAEKNDGRGGRKCIERHHLLQWLPKHDAREEKCNTETVSMKDWGFLIGGGD